MNLLPVFMITDIILLLAAVAMVATRNMVYSALYMVIVFLATAVIYILYQAPLIAMLQIAFLGQVVKGTVSCGKSLLRGSAK